MLITYTLTSYNYIILLKGSHGQGIVCTGEIKKAVHTYSVGQDSTPRSSCTSHET